MKEIIVATTNQGKIAEMVLALAGLPVQVLDVSSFKDIPKPVEDGESFVANALKKANYYALHTGKACLADDSGLEVDALNGAPGVYSARFAGEDATDDQNNQRLLQELKGVAPEQRTARFRCVLAFVDTNGKTMTAAGVREGVIAEEQCGSGGFGYDPLFYMPDQKKTMAQCSKSEKNAISHRGQALNVMTGMLKEYLK